MTLPSTSPSLVRSFRAKTAKQWLEELKPYDSTSVRLAHFGDNGTDPQAVENGFVETVAYPTGFSHQVPTAPFEMDAMEPCPLHPTKPVGADTVKVLQELGYSAAEIQNALKGADPNASTEEMVRHALRAMVMKG